MRKNIIIQYNDTFLVGFVQFSEIITFALQSLIKRSIM